MDPSSSGSGGNSLETAACKDARKRRVCYFYDPEWGNYYYGRDHPMKPHRVRMTHELLRRYGLLSDPRKMRLYTPYIAGPRDFCRYHADDYVAFLRTVTPEMPFSKIGRYLRRFNINTDCPVFDGLYQYCQSYAGASLAAAAGMLNGGFHDIAINWSGGLHHAKKGEASGFCYINDIVLAILDLLKIHERVLYVDIDVHHGDGVEEAFYTTNRVMTVSFHKFGCFFPGTGNIRDIGYSEGKYYCLNVPLDEGIDDERYQSMFKPIISKVMQMFRPGAIVLQCGADSLSGDRLGCFNLSGKGHAECVKFMRSFNVPLLLLGGGGYTIRNVAGCWCNETAVALGEELDDRLPLNDYYTYFGPEYRLHVASSNMENKNTSKQLKEIKHEILDNLSKLPHAPSVQFQERIPEAELPGLDEDQEDPDERHDPDSGMELDDHKPLGHSARRRLIQSIGVEREFTETKTNDQHGSGVTTEHRGPEMMEEDIGSSEQAAVLKSVCVKCCTCSKCRAQATANAMVIDVPGNVKNEPETSPN